MLKRTATLLMLAIAALTFSGIATAQTSPNATTQQQQQVRQLAQKLRQKAAKLQKIHSKTLEANPDLRQQQKAYSEMIRQAIKEQGYDLKAGQERVKNMAKKLKSGELSKEERKAVMQDFAAERKSLNKARAAAMQQPEIRKAGKQLQQDTLAAMKAYSDQTEDLIQSMKQIRQQLRAQMQKSAPSKK